MSASGTSSPPPVYLELPELAKLGAKLRGLPGHFDALDNDTEYEFGGLVNRELSAADSIVGYGDPVGVDMAFGGYIDAVPDGAIVKLIVAAKVLDGDEDKDGAGADDIGPDGGGRVLLKDDDDVIVADVLLLADLLVIVWNVAHEGADVIHEAVAIALCIDGARALAALLVEAAEVAVKRLVNGDQLAEQAEELLVETPAACVVEKLLFRRLARSLQQHPRLVGKVVLMRDFLQFPHQRPYACPVPRCYVPQLSPCGKSYRLPWPRPRAQQPLQPRYDLRHWNLLVMSFSLLEC